MTARQTIDQPVRSLIRRIRVSWPWLCWERYQPLLEVHVLFCLPRPWVEQIFVFRVVLWRMVLRFSIWREFVPEPERVTTKAVGL